MQNAGGFEATSANTDIVKVKNVTGNQITIQAQTTVGSSKITVTYGSFEATCDASVVVKPTASSTENTSTSFPTSYGKIDVVWLSGITNNVSLAPNEPILTSNGESMSKVTWSYFEDGKKDSSDNLIVDAAGNTVNWFEDESPKANWYNYKPISGTVDNNSSMWANAKTANGSYFVWIPRYAYRITYYDKDWTTDSTAQVTGFYDGLGMWKTDGTLKYKLEDGIETINYDGNDYIVHPAFNTDLDLGGWSEKLTGFWFAKYEMSGSTDAELKSVPNVIPNKGTSVGNQYLTTRSATYGFTGTADTFDNKTSYMHSHMVKNSEWGAVTYLTHSQYGRNGHEIDSNDSYRYITGKGSGNTKGSHSDTNPTYDYNTKIGMKSSTTGNVYGVYAMSGGVWERVSAFNRLGNSENITNDDYGKDMTDWCKKTVSQVNDQNEEETVETYISTKYTTVYEYGDSIDSGPNIDHAVKTGDAIKEVRVGYYGWFDDKLGIMLNYAPFLIRGGYSYNTSSDQSGAFASIRHEGNNYAVYWGLRYSYSTLPIEFD